MDYPTISTRKDNAQKDNDNYSLHEIKKYFFLHK